MTSTQEQKFIYACQQGKTQAVKALLKDKELDPSDNNNEGLRWAAYHGYVAIVNLLLNDKRTNNSSNRTSSISLARLKGHTEIVRAFFDKG